MSLPTTGSLSIKDAAGTTRSIALEVDGNLTGDKSLSTLSISAGKDAPHAMTEFYGYPLTNLCVGWDSNTPTECTTSTISKKDKAMTVFCANLPAGDSFSPIYCYNADLSADACYCFLTKRGADGVWVIPQSGTISGNGTFTSYVITDSDTLDVRLILCDNATTKTSCVGICMPDPPATWNVGSGTIERYTYYYWNVEMGTDITLSVSPSSMSFEPTGPEQTATVTTLEGNSWTTSVDYDSWINITNGSGSGDGTFTVTVDKNLSGEVRSGVVCVLSTYAPTDTISVSQMG